MQSFCPSICAQLKHLWKSHASGCGPPAMAASVPPGLAWPQSGEAETGAGAYMPPGEHPIFQASCVDGMAGKVPPAMSQMLAHSCVTHLRDPSGQGAASATWLRHAPVAPALSTCHHHTVASKGPVKTPC